MRKFFVLLAAAMTAAVVASGAGAVITEGTTLVCQFAPSSYPKAAKTQCSSSTFTFLRTATYCNTDTGVLYEYPVYYRVDRGYVYAGNAVAGEPDYSGGTQTPIYRAVKPNAHLISVTDGFAGEFNDTGSGTPVGTC